jgi:hypothetical protein
MKLSIDKWEHLRQLGSADLLQTTFRIISNVKFNFLKKQIYNFCYLECVYKQMVSSGISLEHTSLIKNTCLCKYRILQE